MKLHGRVFKEAPKAETGSEFVIIDSYIKTADSEEGMYKVKVDGRGKATMDGGLRDGLFVEFISGNIVIGGQKPHRRPKMFYN